MIVLSNIKGKRHSIFIIIISVVSAAVVLLFFPVAHAFLYPLILATFYACFFGYKDLRKGKYGLFVYYRLRPAFRCKILSNKITKIEVNLFSGGATYKNTKIFFGNLFFIEFRLNDIDEIERLLVQLDEPYVLDNKNYQGERFTVKLENRQKR